jgi:hypothetical protein
LPVFGFGIRKGSNAVTSLQAIKVGTVSTYNPPAVQPVGNADTIVNSLEPFPNQSSRDACRTSAQTGFVPLPGSCAGGGTGVVSAVVKVGASAVPVVGGIVSALTGIFTAHHAQAVKTEQQVLCAAEPDANNFLRGIDSAVAQGQITMDQAAAALDQGYQNYLQEVSGIIKTGSKCNAACVYSKCFQAAILKRKQDYAFNAASYVAGSQGVPGGVVSAVAGAVSAAVSTAASVLDFGAPDTAQNGKAVFIVGGLVLLGAILFFHFSGGRK